MNYKYHMNMMLGLKLYPALKSQRVFIQLMQNYVAWRDDPKAFFRCETQHLRPLRDVLQSFLSVLKELHGLLCLIMNFISEKSQN